VPISGLAQAIPAFVAVALAAFSVWLGWVSIRTLGKEWSIQARLVEGHRLVTAGPYGAIRHPIYAAMLGMLIATGLVISRPAGLIAGLILAVIGTAIRVHIEERLLREQFQGEFAEYERRVPAVLPRLW
jgi:protein-S-isoprenylcysteine O-methyltransferase Ste14